MATITMQGSRLKLIDTPGFCDDYATEKEHMNEVGEALVLASKGVHAIGLVISAKARYTTNETNTIAYMTDFPELWPYTFIIFSNAGSLGATENDRNTNLHSNFQNSRCPKALNELMKMVDNRYILVESVKLSQNPEAYYQEKTMEVHSMIIKLHEANGKQLYTNVLFDKANVEIDNLMKQKLKEKAELEDQVKELKEVADKREEKQKTSQQAKSNADLLNLERLQIEKEKKEKRRSQYEQMDDEKAANEKEKLEIKEEIQKNTDEKKMLEQSLTEASNKKMEIEARREIAEKLKIELQKEYQIHEELKGKRNRKWYNTLAQKTTGNECVLQ